MLWMCTLASVSPELCFQGAHIPQTIEHSDLLFGKSLECWFWGCFLGPSPWSIGNQLIKTCLGLGSLSNSLGGVVSVHLQVEEHHRPGLCLWGALSGFATLWPWARYLTPLLSFHLCTMGWIIPAMNPSWGGSTGTPFSPSPVFCRISMEHLDFVSLFLVLSVLDTWQGLSLLPATTFLTCLVNVSSFFQTQIECFLST